MTYRNGPSRREKWKRAVLKSTALSHGTRLFLVHTMSKHMAADGFVSWPRERLADEAGVSPRQVARYVSNAVEGGWLVLVGGGYKTMTAEYQATFPNRQRVTQDDTQSEPLKGDVNKHPLEGTIASPFERAKGDASRHTTSSSTTRRLKAVPDQRDVSRITRPQRFRLTAAAYRRTNLRRDESTRRASASRCIPHLRREPNPSIVTKAIQARATMHAKGTKCR